MASKSINTSIVYSSSKYIKSNFRLVVKLSKWIYEELKKNNYRDSKLWRILNNKDFEMKIMLKEIIHLVVDKNILNVYMVRYISNYEVMKLFLENGADVHFADDFMLRCASRYGHDEIVELLLEYGANVHSNDDQALQLAIRCGHIKTSEILFEAYNEK